MTMTAVTMTARPQHYSDLKQRPASRAVADSFRARDERVSHCRGQEHRSADDVSGDQATENMRGPPARASAPTRNVNIPGIQRNIAIVSRRRRV